MLMQMMSSCTTLIVELNMINTWYSNNGMIVNPEKHQAMVLGNCNHKFAFPVNDSIELLGVTLDNELKFNSHITTICDKVNNQFSVIKRFGKLFSKKLLLKLYKVFVLPHFRYCSLIWHFCGKRNTEKLESLNRRIWWPRTAIRKCSFFVKIFI